MACGKGAKEKRGAAGSGEVPDQEMWDSQVILTSTGKQNAIMFAQHISKFEKRKEIKLEGVRVNFFDDQGESTSVLTSRYGRVDELTSNLEAFDSVVVVTRKNATLATERLRWESGAEKIISDTAVRITTDIDTVTGVGFESDPDLEHWEIKSNVKGSFRREVPLQ
jgi:LPS export ABC transporter protein LptC